MTKTPNEPPEPAAAKRVKGQCIGKAAIFAVQERRPWIGQSAFSRPSGTCGVLAHRPGTGVPGYYRDVPPGQ